MRRRQRFDGGRLQAWTAALDHLGEHRALVAQVAAVVLGGAVVINLPFVPVNTYLRGLTTGMVFVAFLWILSWFTWVTSGLAFRIQGTFAQEAVTEQLRDSEHVYEVVASLKFGGRDVDQVMITRVGITAVETKWHSHRPSEQTLQAGANQAAAGARSIRNTLPMLKTAGMPVGSVSAALVLCGPGGRAISSGVMTTGLGPVEVVSARDLDKWLGRRTCGPVGRDFAEQLARELHLLAQTRDEAAVKAGPLLRWLSRVR